MPNLIVFDRLETPAYSIWTIDPVSLAERRIAEGRFPRWAPDGLRLAISRPAGQTMAICVMNADGSEVRQLTRGHVDLNVSWHPDGRSVVFNRIAGPPGGDRAVIMRLDIEDGRLELFTDQVAGWYASAVWHPDGSAVAVATNAYGPAMEVCTMDPAGRMLIRLTHTSQGISGSHLDWSPDGSRILFSAFRDGQVDTFAIDASGCNEARLTRDETRIQSGAKWSPDGQRIVYHATPVGRFDDVIDASELYVMGVESGNEVQLTASPESNAHPDW